MAGTRRRRRRRRGAARAAAAVAAVLLCGAQGGRASEGDSSVAVRHGVLQPVDPPLPADKFPVPDLRGVAPVPVRELGRVFPKGYFDDKGVGRPAQGDPAASAIVSPLDDSMYRPWSDYRPPAKSRLPKAVPLHRPAPKRAADKGNAKAAAEGEGEEEAPAKETAAVSGDAVAATDRNEPDDEEPHGDPRGKPTTHTLTTTDARGEDASAAASLSPPGGAASVALAVAALVLSAAAAGW